MTKWSTGPVDVAANCLACNVRLTGICAAMTPDQLKVVGRQIIKRLVPAGAVLFYEGDDVRTHTNIVKGVVQLSKGMADGRQQIVALQFAPYHLASRTSRVSAFTATESEICMIPASLMQYVTDHNPEVEKVMFRQTLADLDESRNWMLLIGRMTALEKVASLLFMILLRGNPAAQNGQQFDLPLTRSDMADFLGLTIETVSRHMTKLRVLKAIEVTNNRTVTVLSIQRLKEIASG